jgi:cytochrome P450
MSVSTDDPLSLDNLLRPDVQADPYPFYHRLRAADPVHWEATMGWVLTRHADVVATLRDSRFSAERVGFSLDWLPLDLQETLAPATRAFVRQMLFLDPPDHTLLRGLVSKAFTPRVVEGMRPRVQEIVDRLVDGFQDSSEVDVIRALAFPLPVVVIAEMLGVPPEDHAQFTRWTADLGALIDGTNLTAERAMSALQGLMALMDYFRRIIADHRARPRNDLLQGLIAAEDRGDVLSEDELLGNCMLLLAAGHGTTTHLIGNGLLALLRHPNQLRLLRDTPALIGTAVAELLRYDGTVQITSRLAHEDLQIGEQQIRAGENVFTILGAANRDPAQFPDPDRLDITRQENRHVAFGHGIHYCLGAPLAILEGQIALGTLVRRLPNMCLAADDLVWQPSQVFRGLAALPVTLGGSA